MTVNKEKTRKTIADLDREMEERLSKLENIKEMRKTLVDKKDKDITIAKINSINTMILSCLIIILVGGFYAIYNKISDKQPITVNVDTKEFTSKVEQVNSNIDRSKEVTLHEFNKVITDMQDNILYAITEASKKQTKYYSPSVKSTNSKPKYKLKLSKIDNKPVKKKTVNSKPKDILKSVEILPDKEVDKLYKDEDNVKPTIVEKKPLAGFRLIGTGPNGQKLYQNPTTGARYEE